MIIVRSFDYELIRQIMINPAIYPYISDDGTPEPWLFKPIESSQFYYLLVLDNDNIVLGLFLVHPHNIAMYEIHTCLLPHCRGKMADEAGKLVLEWIFENTPCQKVMTHVPEYNRSALKYAERAGMQIEGVNRLSFQKLGQLHDQVLLGITRVEVCQQQQSV